MKRLNFVWDEDKAVANLKKHLVSFNEAKSVFYDDNALEFFDNDHSVSEDRLLLLGLSENLKLLLVVHCYRNDNSTIRIISARKATKNEAKYYKC